MQFFSLYKKTFLFYLRNWVGTLFEILLPIFLAFVIIGLKNQITVTAFPQINYPAMKLPSDISEFQNVDFRFKNCTKGQRQGGLIALSPQNFVTEKLATFFQSKGEKVKYFNNEQEIKQYIERDDYINLDENGNMRQICYAVTFSEFDTKNNKYEYNLRFNITNPATVDHLDPREFLKEPIVPNSFKQSVFLLSNGTPILQSMIESMILKNSLKNVVFDLKLQQMLHIAYKSSSDVTQLPLALYFVLISLFIYYRIISMVVEERERRAIENMENMGMKKINYIGSALCFHFTYYLILSIILVPLIRQAFLPDVQVFFLFVVFWIFAFWMITIAYFISDFFISTKKASIANLVIFFVLYIFQILMEQFFERGTPVTTVLSLSPLGAIGIVSKNLLQAQSVFYPYGFSDINNIINNFYMRTYFIIGILSIIIFFLLAIYCFYVVPLEIGTADHPLFFLGMSWEKQDNSNKIRSGSLVSQESNRSISNFEEVEQELTQQRSLKQNITIQNLVKKFPSGKVAVNNLSLEMYQNQIFSLLGHNGAGKTTTISMISGLLTKTKGEIKIMGFDSHRDRDEIKKIIGVCPQQNPVFDFLSVEEHLIIYAKMKKVEGNIDEQIDQVLKDIDLFHKKKYLAKNLSGGQKRKLCVAMAFIGNSKVILLDEPTSGMDTYARRLLWEMIKKYKQNRLIILTTHNMDEADYLGDRIGIMSDGKMKVCGSSIFLKNKFGTGYELVISKNPDMTVNQVQELIEQIKLISPNSKIIGDVGSELKINLPTQDQEKYQDVFLYIEENQERLCIQNYGISLTTLEEVFLKVAKERDEENKEKSDEEAHLLEGDKGNSIYVEGLADKDLEAIRENSDYKIFTNQMGALFLKQYRYFSRDYISLICQILIPLLIILLTFGLSKIQFIEDVPTISFTPSVYKDYFTFNQNTVTAQKMSGHFPETLKNVKFGDSATNSAFSDYLFQNKNIDSNYAVFLDEITSQKISYITHYNSTASVGAHIGPNLMSNSIMKELVSKDSYIKGNLKPLDNTQGVKNLQDTFSGFILTLLLSLAFSFIPSSMIIFVIKERESNSKHQQFISGMGITAYWFSTFIIDYIKYLIVAILAFILIWVFNVEVVINDGKWGMFLLLLIFFGAAFLPMIYFFSFFFNSSTKGQIFVFIFNFLTGTILVIVGFVLRLLESTSDLQLNVLDYIFRLVPFFSFNYGIINLSNLNLYKLRFKWESLPNAFETRAVLWDLLYLIFMGIVFTILLYLMENSYKFGGKFKALNLGQIKKGIEQENAQNEEDVQQEEDEVSKMDLDKHQILVKDVIKAYPISKAGFCGSTKNVSYKVAVKKVSFGVERGSVFCLLGTNGAGKTSIFKMMTADVYPSDGKIFIQGKEIPENMISIRHLVGYCPQFDALFNNLTGREHLELYANLKGIQKNYQKEIIDDLIKSMSLTMYQDVLAETYSGGNKRKLSVAIALLGRPPIVFLDEPSSGMDPHARRFMWKVIGDISKIKKNSSVILTTHSMEEAEALSSKLAIMVEGRIKTIGTIQNLKNKYGNCYELDIKLKAFDQIAREQSINSLKEQFTAEENIKQKQLDKILAEYQEGKYLEQYSEKGSGKGLWKTMKDLGSIKLDVLADWFMISEKVEQINSFLKEKFNAEQLETYQRFCKFKLPIENKLSSLFGAMEECKDRFRIENYSIRQISLEQIFISFAENVEHDD